MTKIHIHIYTYVQLMIVEGDTEISRGVRVIKRLGGRFKVLLRLTIPTIPTTLCPAGDQPPASMMAA
jgi:hypothetical protein